jgi:pyridoxamine 5'-phosphate oxidase
MIDNKELAQLRRHYSLKALTRSSVKNNPFEQFAEWMNEALNSIIVDPNAMTIATVGEDQKPSLRVVLLKEFDNNGFIFYTNFQSKKGADISSNSEVALHFFWRELERQVTIYGKAEKIPEADSENYFKTRPLDSQLSAWASSQSSIIPNRDYLEQRFNELKMEFIDSEVPKPPFWGGYRIIPDKFEFWQGRENRLHDRICYKKNNGNWELVRLAP